MTPKKTLKKLVMGDAGGFTLLEALIALLVFSIGILATVSMQTTSMNSEMLARQDTEAASIAASLIEDLHPLNYEQDAELTNGAHPLPAQDQYNITYNIQRNTLIDNTMLIQVTVSWTVNNTLRSVNLISIKPDII